MLAVVYLVNIDLANQYLSTGGGYEINLVLSHLCSGVIPASLRTFGSPAPEMYWWIQSKSPFKAAA